MVAGEVAHVGEHMTGKVDVAAPPIGFVIPLIENQPASLDHLTVKAKYVQRCIVAAGTRSGSLSVCKVECHVLHKVVLTLQLCHQAC